MIKIHQAPIGYKSISLRENDSRTQYYMVKFVEHKHEEFIGKKYYKTKDV